MKSKMQIEAETIIARDAALKAAPAEFVNLLRTDKTYATYANAEKALRNAVGQWAVKVPYVIACTSEGRFAPVVIGVNLLPLIHQGITVAA